MRGMNNRIIPTTNATAGDRYGNEDYRETPYRGESCAIHDLKSSIYSRIIGKIKGVWFRWKE